MKKKVAVYANGCAYEYAGTLLDGIEEAAKDANVDLYVFLNFTSTIETKEDNAGELNIYSLADMSAFDGVLLLSNQFNSPTVAEAFRKYIVDNRICCVNLESNLEGLPNVLTDNSVGTYQLAKHLIEEHGVKNIVYCNGPEDLEEARERYEGIVRAAKEYGISVDGVDHYIPGVWSYYSGRDGVTQWMKEHDNRLPDAFMCANDYKAMGVCTGLKKMGFEVPRDVIVTGYDNLMEARVFSPGITSVNRNGWTVGFNGMNHLIALMDEENPEPPAIVETKMAVEESCGCFNLLKNASLRNRAYNNNFIGSMNTVDYSRRARVLESKAAAINEKQELFHCMEEFFMSDPYLEDADVAIILDDCFLASVEDSSVALRTQGYSEQVDVLFCKKGNKAVSVEGLRAKDLLPDIFLDDEVSHSYFFVPLHARENSLGYVVFADCLYKVSEALLYNWMNSMYQLLSNVHKNMQLTNINMKLLESSITDIQTGLLNRTGYNRKVIPFLVNNHEEGKKSVVILVDINRMKRINDIYGHQQGDLAIATIGESIRHVIPKEWLGVRYGGDEFLIAGVCDKEEYATFIIEQLEKTVENKNEALGLSFHLSISCGYTVISEREPFSLDDSVHRADEMMYQVKQQKHAVDI